MLQPSSVDPTEIISIDGISSGSTDAVPQGKKVIEVVAGGKVSVDYRFANINGGPHYPWHRRDSHQHLTRSSFA